MSTILKSLKKLEKEKEGRNPPVPAPALITSAGTQQAIQRTVRFAWLRGRILHWSIIGAGCLFVFAITIYAFSRPNPFKSKIASVSKAVVQPVKPQPRSIKSAPLAAAPPAVQETGPKTVEMRNPQQSEEPPSAVSLLSMPVAQRPETEATSPPVAPSSLAKNGFETLGQKPAPSTMGTAPVQKRRPQPTPAQLPPADPATKLEPDDSEGISEESLSGERTLVAPESSIAGTRMERDASMRAAPENQLSVPTPTPAGMPSPTQPRTPSQATPARPEEAAFAGAERMTNGSLKVQAIVFAPSAEERMAVVNNTIVREGSAIESYTIVGIGEEDVYVREGQGRLLKVPFGKP